MANFTEVIESVEPKLNSFFTSVFDKIEINGPKLDPKQLQRNPVMIVSTHRSHTDYFLIGWLSHKMGFCNLRFAAGDNLTNLPWIGPKFTHFGAFTVERDTGFERHYVRNLCEQVAKMLEEKQAVIVFPEGGRSYNGQMLEIKSGVISAAVLSQARNCERDVWLLPYAVSYDGPPDLPFFKLLLKGKRLRKRGNSFFKRLLGNLYYFGADILAFLPFYLHLKFKRSYGNAYVDYLEPVSLKTLVDLNKNKIAGARDDFSAHRASMNLVGLEIRKRFNSIYRILPMHVVSQVLTHNKPLTMEQLSQLVVPMIEKAVADGRNCMQIKNIGAQEVVKQGLEKLIKLKGVSVNKGIVEIRKHEIVDYYAAALN